MGILDAPGLTQTTGELKHIYGAGYERRFRTAMANRATAPIDILFMGDSKTEGTGANSPGTRWINRFLSQYRAAYQPSGVTGGFGYVPARYQTSAFGTSFTLGGTATAVGTYGIGRRNVNLGASGATATITVGPATSYGAVTSVDIIYLQGSGVGNATVTTDGGAPATITAVTTPTVAGQRYRISGLNPLTSHTFVIAWASGGTFSLEGIMLYNGDETIGIRAWDGSHHGIKVSNYTILTDLWWQSIKAINPALIYYQIGCNDLGAGDTVANVVANTTAQINYLKTLCSPGVTIIYGMDWEANSTANTAAYQTWRSAMRQMALTDGTIGFFDLWPVLGNTRTTGDDVYHFTADQLHPTDPLGAQVIADAFVSYVRTTTTRDSLPTSGGKLTGTLDLSSNKIISLATPTNSTDAATKGYVDGLVVGGGSGITRNVQTLTTTATVGAAALTDYVVFIGASGAPTLPTAVGNTNMYTLKNIDSTNKTVATTSSQTIDGSTTITLTPNTSVDAISDGANWRLV